MPTSIEPVIHGALDFSELEQLGLQPDDILDFSTNTNPFGPSPKVREALTNLPLGRYPDRESFALRRALANHLGISPQQIMPGNGTSELIQLIALAFLRPGQHVLILGPTYGEYERAARMMGADVHIWMANLETGFIFDEDAICSQLKKLPYHLVFLCNPNNPTGQIIPVSALAAWAKAHPKTLFIIDEAYISFAPHLESAIDIHAENILILRSMTKDYALAGLRIGYVVGTSSAINTLTRIRPPWNVNALAQAAGLAALHDQEYLSCTLSKLQQEKDFLQAALKQLGFSTIPSAAHFFLVAVRQADCLRHDLLLLNILVRDCASFGLPGYIRIAPRLHPENIHFLKVIKSFDQLYT
jgi:L-threonine-O-3-phosphate decarboxylase